MCDRFTLTADPADLQAAFNLAEAPPALAPRYNIAPTQPVAVAANNSGDKLEFFLDESRPSVHIGEQLMKRLSANAMWGIID